jgi:hypothetical protein
MMRFRGVASVVAHVRYTVADSHRATYVFLVDDPLGGGKFDQRALVLGFRPNFAIVPITWVNCTVWHFERLPYWQRRDLIERVIQGRPLDFLWHHTLVPRLV